MAAAAQYNENIIIYRRALSRNEYGQEQENFNPYRRTKAKVDYINGNKSVENDEIVQNFSKNFTVRSYVDVRTTDRIFWQGNYYRVFNVEIQKANNQIVVQTELINE